MTSVYDVYTPNIIRYITNLTSNITTIKSTMRKLLTILCLLTIAVSSFAKAYKVDELPVKTEYMDSTDFSAVCNPDGVLSEQEVAAINQRLWKLKSTMDVQGLVIAVKESDPVDGYDFAMQAARKFGVGGKNNLGFVVFLSTVSRKYYILTGTGMEKFLTDAEASDIGRHIMVPLLKNGQWGAAMMKGVAAIDDICNGEITPAEIAQMDKATEMTQQPEADDGSFWLGLLAFGGAVGGGVAYWRKKDKKARTCPKCQKEGALNHVFRNVSYLADGTTPESIAADKQRKLLNDAEAAKITQLMNQVKAAQENVKGSSAQSGMSMLSDYEEKKELRAYEAAAGAEHRSEDEYDDMKPARKVLVREYCQCSECGALTEEKKVSTDKTFRTGSFNGFGPLQWGAVIAAATVAANAPSIGGSSFGSGRSFGGGGSSRHSSSTFGGGKFGGGGAGGSF